jgi:hypothetical protein
MFNGYSVLVTPGIFTKSNILTGVISLLYSPEIEINLFTANSGKTSYSNEKYLYNALSFGCLKTK